MLPKGMLFVFMPTRLAGEVWPGQRSGAWPGPKRGLRGTLLVQVLGESASRRSEPKTFSCFADKLQRKTPGLGGRREEHENPG